MEPAVALTGLLGTSIQAVFSWMSYNRDSYAMNVGWRQSQQYQERNYQINWVALARDDIRDLMGVSVHHAANALMISTLLLSVTAVSFVCAGFASTVPTFVVLGFYASAGTAVVFLMVAIMFGVKSQDKAYENTMELLAFRMRPLNMAKHEHDYMKQAQEVERVGILRGLFRVPGADPSYSRDDKDAPPEPTEGHGRGIFRRSRSHSAPPASRSGAGEAHDTTPVEVLDKQQSMSAHLTRFEELMRIWKPHEESSKLCTGLGVACIAQASVYFALGKVVGRPGARQEEDLLACVIVVVFIFVQLMTFRNFRQGPRGVRLGLVVLLASGPVCAALAAALGSVSAQAGLVPAAFGCHLAFWFGACAAMGAAAQHGAHGAKGGHGVPHHGAHGGHADHAPDDAHAEHGGSSAPRAHGHLPAPVGHDSHAAQDGHAQDGHARGHDGRGDHDGHGHGHNGHAAHNGQDHGTGGAFSLVDVGPNAGPNLDRRAAAKEAFALRTVRLSMSCCCLIWCAMLAWSLAHFHPLRKAQTAVPNGPTAAAWKRTVVEWPSALYRPKLLDCAGGQVFSSDGYRIFELFPGGGPAVEVPCAGLNRPVMDLSAFCNQRLCRPIVLTRGDASGAAAQVIDCGAGSGNSTSATPIASIAAPRRLAVLSRIRSKQEALSDAKLLLDVGGELVQYSWSAGEASWRPEWSLSSGHIEGRELRAVSSSSSDLLRFMAPAGAANAFVEVRSSETLDLRGHWLAPESFAPPVAGCALSTSLVLALVYKEAPGAPPTIMQAALL